MGGQDWDKAIAALSHARVLVAGDIMLDRFVYGHVDRISPESPVPVLTIDRQETMLGGAGNALANLVGLGAKAAILSITGDDAAGEEIRAKASLLGIGLEGLVADPARPTIIKTRFLAGHQQLLRTDAEKILPLSAALEKKILALAETLIAKADCLLLSDYGKGMLSPNFLGALIGLAKKHGLPVIVDPKGFDFSIYAGADIVTPNRKELSEACHGAPTATDTDIVAACETIIRDCGIPTIVATRSRDGLSVVSQGHPPLHLPTGHIEVFDVSGAGDAVIATLAAGLASGLPIEKAAHLANLAGTIVVAKVGTAGIRADELAAACQKDAYQYAGKQTPVTDSAAAAEHVARWRARGLRVGFTNGCFDILHAGHVSYLNAARGKCDRLIVALNRDSSVRLLKGEGRPVHDEQARAAVLGALSAIDLVLLFGAEKSGADNTAGALLAALKPDIYFKGGDYTKDRIPEAPLVESYGGELIIIPAIEGQSTTASLKRIKSQAS